MSTKSFKDIIKWPIIYHPAHHICLHLLFLDIWGQNKKHVHIYTIEHERVLGTLNIIIRIT